MGQMLACSVALAIAISVASGAVPEAAERVRFADGKTWVWQAGAPSLCVSAVAMPFDILVETNGTYTVAGGRVRQMLDGEILGADGMLLRPDGQIVPVIDHITMNRGRVMVMRDGDFQPLSETARLGNGMFVQADGKVITASGSSRRLLDGELLQFRGGALPARDTITVHDGQVMVQKDGTMILLGAGRTIMMNNGTKVFSDGSFVDFAGQRFHLQDGDIQVIEGVLVRPR